jgi:nitrogen regulatory protein P-II 1
MKLVIAIVRPEKLNDVLEALYRAEVTGLTISRVRGHGGETEQVETYRGMTVKVELHDKVRLEIGVSDSFVDATVRGCDEGRDREDGGRQDGRGSSHR